MSKAGVEGVARSPFRLNPFTTDELVLSIFIRRIIVPYRRPSGGAPAMRFDGLA
jgi:hypothetical protein